MFILLYIPDALTTAPFRGTTHPAPSLDTMRTGKEPVHASDQPEAPETSADSRWLNGVNRQLRPDAASHQRAASEAAAGKRKAAATTGEEKDAAERRRADRRNAAKRAKRAAAAAAIQAAQVASGNAAVAEEVAAVLYDIVEQLELDAVDDVEWEAFMGWLEAQDRDDKTLAILHDWRMTHEYEVWFAAAVAEQWRMDDAQFEALQMREAELQAQREAQRRLDLEHGSPFEWAQRDEGERWALLEREQLAGQRHRYSKLRLFMGSVAEAEIHVGWDTEEGYATAEDEEEEDMAAGRASREEGAPTVCAHVDGGAALHAPAGDRSSAAVG
jgi:hypothetical protein